MAIKKKNTFTTGGDVVTVDIRTKTHQDAEMLIDLDDWLKLEALQNAGRLGRIYCSQSKTHHTGYAKAWLDSKHIQIHRLLLPDSIMVDHISRETLDNRRCNIREADSSLNNRNRRKRSDNTSGITGVCWHKASRKWQARIYFNKKQIELGIFTDLDEAIAVRKAAEVENGYLND